ncbi:MAG TPA: prepilin-type N-terminal cleavage/methylation domain-containing protein [Candidatus Sulfotelmatobacter sp.]|nr:prepilin-type N-terminal cleavage/methylation domain-containing protein [Candidatus Sulfotelmatobacter sp.]
MGWTKKRGRQQGFTFIELMVSVAILTLVVGVVVEGLTKLMQRNTTETSKTDLTQESREFMDQVVNDIHQSGYPSVKMFDPATLLPASNPVNCNLYVQVACGLVSVTPSALQFEGDVDGSGTVSEVFIQLSPLNGPCPCIIQRGAVSKTLWQGGTLPAYYTEVTNVNNTNIFQGYDNGGNNVALVGAPSNNLAAIEITLSVKATVADTDGSYPIVNMSTSTKIHNIN